jgi:hypothetical protein
MKNRASQRHAMEPARVRRRDSVGASTAAMQAIGIAKACLRLRKWARMRLNTRPGS